MKGGEIPYLVAMVGGIVAAVFVLLAVDHLPPHAQKNSLCGEKLKLKLHSKGRMTT